MKNLLIVCAFLFVGINAKAQDDFIESKEDLVILCEAATDHFMNHKISKLMKDLGPYWPIPDNEKEAFAEKTIKTLNLVHERYGDAIGNQFSREETIGDFAIRRTYVVLYDNIAMRVIFTFYKNPKGWIVNGFSWDDSFEEEFR